MYCSKSRGAMPARLLSLLAALLCSVPLAAAPAPAGSQAAQAEAVSDAERKAFFDFYARTFPDDHGEQPVFGPRAAGAGLVAHVDSPPRRGLRALCRMERRVFAYQNGWTVEPVRRQFVWIEPNACTRAGQPVALQSPMPDADVLGLLERERAMLQSARLLFGGNSQCARQRALNFSLAGIVIGTSGSSTEVLAGLAFRSDRNSSATVWVRRSGLDYTAWNVSCQ